MSEVFLARIGNSDSPAAIAAGIATLWQRAGLATVFEARDLAAVKLHVGEPGTKTFLRPEVVAPLVAQVAATGAKPFLTDTAVLYRSPRDNAVTHVGVARDHGFTVEAV
ncbi:MAG: DUF362 domain-containing protein [Deltaproteobacteria bacterium]|jgi:uncharacterized Fe-S center protein|nr:DUF362 domain-containing protein [Deltaproteobacteria bacterium]MBW2534260.1 DUF362 domain-containing protein [Deltaproteobacteria bacterium]